MPIARGEEYFPRTYLPATGKENSWLVSPLPARSSPEGRKGSGEAPKKYTPPRRGKRRGERRFIYG